MQLARAALDNTRFTGEPQVKDAQGNNGARISGDQNVPPNQGFDMGQVRCLYTLRSWVHVQLVLSTHDRRPILAVRHKQAL